MFMSKGIGRFFGTITKKEQERNKEKERERERERLRERRRERGGYENTYFSKKNSL